MKAKAYREPLQKSWLDAYGHLNEGYYMVLFGNANWDFCEQMGMGVAYYGQSNCGYYTAEAHIRYLKEIRYPAEPEIAALVVSVGQKKVHMIQEMRVEGELCATNELISIHVDMALGKSAPIPADVKENLAARLLAQPPDWAGRGISS